MNGLAYGTRIVYARATRAEVIMPERRYGQAGYRVWDWPSGDPGAVRPNPRWVPADSVRRVISGGKCCTEAPICCCNVHVCTCACSGCWCRRD